MVTGDHGLPTVGRYSLARPFFSSRNLFSSTLLVEIGPGMTKYREKGKWGKKGHEDGAVGMNCNALRTSFSGLI